MDISIDGKSVRVTATAGEPGKDISVVMDLTAEKADEVWRAMRTAVYMLRKQAKTQTVEIDRATFDRAA